MDESHFLGSLKSYFKAFAETEESKRLVLLRTAMTPNAEIWGPKRVFAGCDQISEKISGFHRNWRGCRLVLDMGLNMFLNSARIGGVIVGPNDAVRARCEALVELAPDGRIERVIPFWEPLPHYRLRGLMNLRGLLARARVRPKATLIKSTAGTLHALIST